MVKISKLSQTQFAEKVLGIKGGNVSGARKSGKIPDRWFEIMLEKFGITKDELCQPPVQVVRTVERSLGGGWHNRRKVDHLPTATFENLRWIVEWMNEYYAEHPSESMCLYEELKDRFPSFREFIKKKRTGENH